MSRNRKEFSTKTKLQGWKRCCGRCEGIVVDPESGASNRCNAALAPGRFHYDHVNPDAMTGQPTLENLAVLCLLCHAIKTGEDVRKIAKAKRIEARETNTQARNAARKIESAGFPSSGKRRENPIPLPPRRAMFR